MWRVLLGLAGLAVACSPAGTTPTPPQASAQEPNGARALLEELQGVVMQSDPSYRLPSAAQTKLEGLVDTALSNYLLMIGAVVSVPAQQRAKAFEQGLPIVEGEPYRGAQFALNAGADGFQAPCIESATEGDRSYAAKYLDTISLAKLEDPPDQAVALDRRLQRVEWQGLVFGCQASLDRQYVGLAEGKLVFLVLPRQHGDTPLALE